MRSHRGRGVTLPRQWPPRPASKMEDRSVTWFQPLWRHGLQRLDFQIERGGVSQTDTWLLRSDHDPESDERIIVAGQRIVRIAMVRGLRGRAAPGMELSAKN